MLFPHLKPRTRGIIPNLMDFALSKPFRFFSGFAVRIDRNANSGYTMMITDAKRKKEGVLI